MSMLMDQEQINLLEQILKSQQELAASFKELSQAITQQTIAIHALAASNERIADTMVDQLTEASGEDEAEPVLPATLDAGMGG